QAKAHDVLGFQTGNSQYRQGPERLQHIGPGVAPGNGHGGARHVRIQSLCGSNHDRALYGPLATARGHKDIDQTGAHEGPEGQGGRRGKGHHPLGQAGSQTGVDHDGHDACVEGELNHNPGTATNGLIQAFQQAARGAMQQDGQNQESEVDHVQVQGRTTQHVVVKQVGQSSNTNHDGDQTTVFQTVCWTIGGLLDVVRRVFQQLGIDVNAFLVAGQHQAVDQRHQDEQG